MGYSDKTVVDQRSDRSRLSHVSLKSESVDEAAREEPKLPTTLLVALTCSIGGLQPVWLTIFSHGSSYLSSLGISDVSTSLIWTIAPICGVIVSPITGVISDRSRISWGKRRPFMIIGAIAIILSVTALAWIEPIAALICSLHNNSSHGGPALAALVLQYWAIFWVIILNVGIQILQSASRSLIIDVCPAEQQSPASAWAGRFTGVGNILGYLIGSMPLPVLAGDHEAWRFRCMSLFAVILLSFTVSVTVYFIKEENPQDTLYDVEAPEWLIVRTFRGVVQSVVRMPPKARRVCRVQFFSAMGWFGFLFYNTSYVSGLYFDNTEQEGLLHGAAHKDHGMRFATTASLLFAVVALGTNVVLPYIKSSPASGTSCRKSTWSIYFHSLRQIHILWSIGLILYTFLMLSTLFISCSFTATATIAIAGLSWGVTQWAPFALIGEEIAAQQAEQDPELGDKKGLVENQSGAMLGVHSAAICLPQILAAVACSGVFWVAESWGMENAVVWVLRGSGIAGGVAAWFAWKM